MKRGMGDPAAQAPKDADPETAQRPVDRLLSEKSPAPRSLRNSVLLAETWAPASRAWQKWAFLWRS